jgi:predicted enzyme related to lactoylglutathione lyase
VVADAEGAPFGLLDSTSGDPADYRAEPGEWLWVSLYSQDGEAASRFYRSQFGYEITEADDTGDGPGYFLSKGGYVRAGISHLSTESESHPTWVGYIRVEDVGGYVTKAVGLGGEVMVGQAPAILDGNLAVVSDPTGAPIALIHWNFDDQEVVQ